MIAVGRSTASVLLITSTFTPASTPTPASASILELDQGCDNSGRCDWQVQARCCNALLVACRPLPGLLLAVLEGRELHARVLVINAECHMVLLSEGVVEVRCEPSLIALTA
jgi:hypothetical protein